MSPCRSCSRPWAAVFALRSGTLVSTSLRHPWPGSGASAFVLLAAGGVFMPQHDRGSRFLASAPTFGQRLDQVLADARERLGSRLVDPVVYTQALPVPCRFVVCAHAPRTAAAPRPEREREIAPERQRSNQPAECSCQVTQPPRCVQQVRSTPLVLDPVPDWTPRNRYRAVHTSGSSGPERSPGHYISLARPNAAPSRRP